MIMPSNGLQYHVSSWFQVRDMFILYAAIGLTIVLYGLFATIFKHRLLINDVLFSLLLGILLGSIPSVYTLIDVSTWMLRIPKEQLVLEISRITLGIQLFSTALRLPKHYFWRNFRQLFTLLIVVLPLTWITSTLIAWSLFPMHSFFLASLLGAIGISTDPVVAATILTGRFAEQKLNHGIRNLLSAESGANDGLAGPYFSISLIFLIAINTSLISAASTSLLFVHWILIVLVYEILLSILIGYIIGYIVGTILLISERKKLSDKQSVLALTIGLTFFVLGIMYIFNMNALLAVFASGVSFNDAVPNATERAEEGDVQDAVDLVFTIAFFVFLGIVLPYDGWYSGIYEWRGPLFCILSILFRRVAYILVLYPLLKPTIRSWKEALWYGWFGPIGVSAIYYSASAWYTLKEYEETKPIGEFVWYLGTLWVVVSCIAYGISAVPMTYILFHTHRPSTDPHKRSRRGCLDPRPHNPHHPRPDLQIPQELDENHQNQNVQSTSS